MEGFSQSRGDDDLFDDEIVPVNSPQEAVVETATPPKTHELTNLDNVPKGPSSHARGYGGNSRGRGGPRGRGGDDLLSSRYAPHQPPAQTQTQPPPLPPPQPEPKQSQPPVSSPAEQPLPSESQPVPENSQDLIVNGDASSTNNKPTTDNIETPPNPHAPQAEPTPARPPAVRGDRTATGGVKKPKLTEDELTAKLAAAKERSQNLSAAHARAQADAVSFEQRERIAQEKRAKDAVNRKVMDNERERNRERKLKGMGGREWDAEKGELDIRSQARERGGNGFFRGAHGGVRQDRQHQLQDYRSGGEDSRSFERNDDRGIGRGGLPRGKGRGGRGGGGGGAGRGGSHFARGGDSRDSRQQPDVNAEADFPTLPPAPSKQNGTTSGKQAAEKQTPTPSAPAPARSPTEALSPLNEAISTWAEQVEAATPK